MCHGWMHHVFQVWLRMAHGAQSNVLKKSSCYKGQRRPTREMLGFWGDELGWKGAECLLPSRNMWVADNSSESLEPNCQFSVRRIKDNHFGVRMPLGDLYLRGSKFKDPFNLGNAANSDFLRMLGQHLLCNLRMAMSSLLTRWFSTCFSTAFELVLSWGGHGATLKLPWANIGGSRLRNNSFSFPGRCWNVSWTIWMHKTWILEKLGETWWDHILVPVSSKIPCGSTHRNHHLFLGAVDGILFENRLLKPTHDFLETLAEVSKPRTEWVPKAAKSSAFF